MSKGFLEYERRKIYSNVRKKKPRREKNENMLWEKNIFIYTGAEAKNENDNLHTF